MEEWKVIEGFSRYEVSNKGRVRSRKRNFIRKQLNFRGYRTLSLLSDSGINKTVFVHRLVALAFLGPPTAQTVNHKDFNRENNCVENLEYLSHADNLRYSHQNGRYPSATNPTGFNGHASRKGSAHTRAKLTDIDVLTIRKINASPRLLADVYGVSVQCIRDIKNRRTWDHL